MITSFEEFLCNGKFGELSLTDEKSSIISKLGIPSWWDGQGTFSYEQSRVWVYGDLGVVFERDGPRIERLEIVFGGGGTKGRPRVPIDFHFDDISVSSETTLDEVINYLQTKAIPFNQMAGGFGAVQIQFPSGIKAVFKNRLDFARSTAEGRRVTSEEKELDSICFERTDSAGDPRS